MVSLMPTSPATAAATRPSPSPWAARRGRRCWSRSRSAGRTACSSSLALVEVALLLAPTGTGRASARPGSAAAAGWWRCRRRAGRRRRSGSRSWSAAYWTALRQSTLSNGATLVLIEMYRMRRCRGSSAFFFRLGRSSDLALRSPAATPVPAMSTSRSPASSRLSMSSALTLSCDLDAVRQRLAVRVGRRVPVGVADQREALARLVGLELVRAGRDHVLLVLRAGVLGLRHRRRRRQHREVVEAARTAASGGRRSCGRPASRSP